jgi:hypothetical protein
MEEGKDVWRIEKVGEGDNGGRKGRMEERGDR